MENLEYLKKRYESDILAANLRYKKNAALLKNRLEYLDLVFDIESKKLEDKLADQPDISTKPNTKVEQPKVEKPKNEKKEQKEKKNVTK